MFQFQNIKNIKNKLGKISYGNFFNTIQILSLNKHEIYPNFSDNFMKNYKTHIIINSGKLIIDMKKFDKKTKNFKYQCLFAESDILYKTTNNNDIILTDKKYILTIKPCVFYSFYAYDNTNFQLFYKSD